MRSLSRAAFLLAVGPVLMTQVPPVSKALNLANGQVNLELQIRDGHLVSERLATQPGWAATNGPGMALETDGGFTVEVVWNDWQAPGKANNGDVLCAFGPKDYKLVADRREKRDGKEILSLTFHGPEYMGLELEYALGADAPWIRRRLRVFELPHKQYARKDESPTGHLLHALQRAEELAREVGEA